MLTRADVRPAAGVAGAGGTADDVRCRRRPRRDLRRGERQPLRRRPPAPHPGRRAALSRREPAGGNRAAAGGEGTRAADGRDFVSPDDVKAVAEPVLAHRLILAPEARAAGLTAESSSARRSSTRRSRYDHRAAVSRSPWARDLPCRLGLRLGRLPGRDRTRRSAVLLAWLWTALATGRCRSGGRCRRESGSRGGRRSRSARPRARLVARARTLRERIGKLGEPSTPLGAGRPARYVLRRAARSLRVRGAPSR